jgi:hypothetical protein
VKILTFIAIKAFIITINTINTINMSSRHERLINLSDKAREAFITLFSFTLPSAFKRIIVAFIATIASINLKPPI